MLNGTADFRRNDDGDLQLQSQWQGVTVAPARNERAYQGARARLEGRCRPVEPSQMAGAHERQLTHLAG